MEDVLKKYNFTFKKRYGQNFITDLNLLDAIAADAGAEGRRVLEIGAGAGALTRALSKRAERVLAYEIDPALRPVLAETLAGCENTEVVFRDFLREDMAAVERELGGDYVVAANLPYYVTTPVIMRLAEESEGCRLLTVMVQAEVADRLCAKEGTKEYGAITAAIARRGTCKILRQVSRNLFTPRPNVDSAVVQLDFRTGGFSVKDEEMFRRTVRCAFQNRRKTLKNNLMSAFSLTRESAEELLARLELPADVRGEALSPHCLGALSDLLSE